MCIRDSGNIRAWDVVERRMLWETEAGGRLYDIQVWNNILVGAVTPDDQRSYVRFWVVSSSRIEFLYDVLLGDVIRIFSMVIHQGIVICCCATKVVQIEFGKMQHSRELQLHSPEVAVSSSPHANANPHNKDSACILS